MSYDFNMVWNDKTRSNKLSHVSLQTYKNAVILTKSCNFLSFGSYLLILYGKPKDRSDVTSHPFAIASK